MRVIHLPAIDKTVSFKAYIQAVQTAKANPTQTFQHGLTCWWPCTGKDILEQFIEGMQDRINQATPYQERH